MSIVTKLPILSKIGDKFFLDGTEINGIIKFDINGNAKETILCLELAVDLGDINPLNVTVGNPKIELGEWADASKIIEAVKQYCLAIRETSV